MDVGVARTKEQGQKTTKTVTALEISPVIKYTIIANKIAKGIKTLAHLSAILCGRFFIFRFFYQFN